MNKSGQLLGSTPMHPLEKSAPLLSNENWSAPAEYLFQIKQDISKELFDM